MADPGERIDVDEGIGRIELRRKNGPGLWALVDLADLERVQQWRWRALVLPHATYAQGRVVQGGRIVNISMHRFILGTSRGILVDHRDHDGLNNQRANLRPATSRQNGGNKLPGVGQSSRYKGVVWDVGKGMWVVRIRTQGGLRRYVGRYRDEVEAALAYDAAARDAFGGFALVNFPNAPPGLVA